MQRTNTIVHPDTMPAAPGRGIEPNEMPRTASRQGLLPPVLCSVQFSRPGVHRHDHDPDRISIHADVFELNPREQQRRWRLPAGPDNATDTGPRFPESASRHTSAPGEDKSQSSSPPASTAPNQPRRRTAPVHMPGIAKDETRDGDDYRGESRCRWRPTKNKWFSYDARRSVQKLNSAR